MISPDWPGAPILAGVLFAFVVIGLAVNAIIKDRRGYRRFARLRSSRRRRRVMRTWLLTSFFVFGGIAIVLLALFAPWAPLLLDAVWSVDWVAGLRADAAAAPWVVAIAVGVFLVTVVALTVVGIRAARVEGELPAVGDIRALLPRNRRELVWGALLSINAGLVEELLFRLAVPAVVFAFSGSAPIAIIVSLVVFAALHLYQGVAGVVGALVLGGFFMALYLASGSIALAIVVHAVIDLRSLVLLPIAVQRVHTVAARD